MEAILIVAVFKAILFTLGAVCLVISWSWTPTVFKKETPIIIKVCIALIQILLGAIAYGLFSLIFI